MVDNQKASTYIVLYFISARDIRILSRMCSGANEVRKVKCMSDLISREAVIKAMENNSYMVEVYGTKTKIIDGMMMCCEIADLPTIEAVPVVHGYNNNQNYHEVDEFRCSVCGLHLEDWSRRIFDEDTGDEFFVEYAFKYCPNCGSKMDGGK